MGPSKTGLIKTGQRGVGNPISEFAALLTTVREAGLLRKRRTFYILTFASVTLLTVAAWFGFALIGDSWFTLIIAAVLGILFTQYAFLAHEAAHRQVFESGKANDLSGRIIADLLVGISYSWWMNKHTRHHGNPNTQGKDPDIEPDFILFQKEDAAKVGNKIGAMFYRRQGFFFFPILLLEGINLHRQAFITVFSKGKVDKRALEIVLLLVRNLSYLAVVFTFLPLGMAFAFVGVQLAVFGLYMGTSFAPNHIGMRILPADSKVDFLRRQVLTSRNVTGGWVMNHFMGGLNYQVEHHLFPSMPRPHLRKANEIVKEYCLARNIEYSENNYLDAQAIVLAYLNKVGLVAGSKSWSCPEAQTFGR